MTHYSRCRRSRRPRRSKRRSRGGREELPALRPQPGPVAAAVAGGVAAGEAPGPLRERTGGGGTDLSAIRAAYTEERGYPPYDPRLMVKLLIYGYCTGQRSSRVIEGRCHDDVAFRYLAAGAAPDYRSIARFRRRHLEALAGLFLQALQLCQKAGMVRLGKVALDGTKLRANASRHKAMSYKRMVEREAQLEAEIDAMLAGAERVDAAEDERFGPDGRDDDLPDELNRRVDRLLKIREAKAALR